MDKINHELHELSRILFITVISFKIVKFVFKKFGQIYFKDTQKGALFNDI
jgi:hypothetical protein